MHPYNELARRLLAAALSYHLRISFAAAYDQAPAEPSAFWLALAESLDRELYDRLAAQILAPMPAETSKRVN